MWDLSLVDPILSPLGRRQIVENQAKIHRLEVRKVLVSPLRRTLETCEGLFKDHPMKPEIHICPWLTEQVGTISELSRLTKHPDSDFDHWNWRMLHEIPDDFWQFGVVTTEKFQELRAKYTDLSSFSTVVAQRMKELYPDCLENPEETAYRCIKLKALLEEEVKKGPVALVGHQSYFKQFTWMQTGKAVVLENCQVSEQRLG